MSLPPLPAGPRARPAPVVLALAVAICTIQALGLWDDRAGAVAGVAALLRATATIGLTGLLTAYHLRRRKVGLLLARSESRYRMLAQETADLMILIGPDPATITISPALLALLGIRRGVFGTRTIERLVHADDRAEIIDRLGR